MPPHRRGKLPASAPSKITKQCAQIQSQQDSRNSATFLLATAKRTTGVDDMNRLSACDETGDCAVYCGPCANPFYCAKAVATIESVDTITAGKIRQIASASD